MRLTLVALILIFSNWFSNLFGQSAGQPRVTITATGVYAGVNGDPFTDEFTWLLKANNGTQYCIAIDGEARWFDINQLLVNNAVISNMDVDIPLSLDAWEDDSGSRCLYFGGDGVTNGDDLRCTEETTIKLSSLPPGVTNVFDKYFCNFSYGVRYAISYTPPVPARPAIARGSTELGPACPTETIQLSANNFVNPLFQSSVTLTWEYRIPKHIEYEGGIPNPAYCGGYGLCVPDPDVFGGVVPACCSEPEFIWGTIRDYVGTPWRTINTSIGTASVPVLLSSLDLSTLDAPSFMEFRVRSSAGGKTSSYSESNQLDVSPVAPTIASLIPSPSCKNSFTGEIVLNITNGTTNTYRAFAILGSEQFGLPENFSGTTAIIDSLKAGNYRIQVANQESAGCRSEGFVSVTLHSNLSFSDPPSVVQHISCEGNSDGIIAVSASGGKPGAQIDFTIFPNDGNFFRTSLNSGEFRNLPANADYKITATDNCMDPITSSSILISQPTRVTASIASTSPNCTNPSNGTLSITGVANGSGIFNYYVYQGASLVRSNIGTTSTTWSITDLPSGAYAVDIRDAARASCPGYLNSFTLNSVAFLGLSVSVKEDVKCFGQNNGKINLSALGGSANYLYSIVNTTTSQNFGPQTSANFSDLSPGIYTATVKNNNGCLDSFTINSIEIKQPDDFVFSFSVKRITCKGDDNGEINATPPPTGGNGGNVYQWQFYEGAAWIDDYSVSGSNTLNIKDVTPGVYRLRVVRDSKDCSAFSQAVSMSEPMASLAITSLAVQQVTCKGYADGKISINPIGGWGGYTYQYSLNGITYFDFLASTNLPPDNYYVRVKDAEGCTFDYADQIEITEPSAVLSATYSFSSYNGFKVSCASGNDGTISIIGTGGNGAPFLSGTYTYSMDGGSFNLTNFFSNLNAGDHTVRVKDGRGCIYTEVIPFNAPNALGLQLVSKNYIKCFGDTNGFIEVAAIDGVLPYQYKNGTGTFGTNNRFTNLLAGSYQITVRDKNSCETILNETIDSPNPPLIISFIKSDVSCFGLADGKITATVAGGFPNYTYEWISRTETIPVIQNLAPGTYTLKVTDQELCSQTKSIIISQPTAPLGATLVAKPIQCFGEITGQLILTSTGGTPPYTYSIDNGLSYQSANTFLNIGKGTYLILVKDDRGCTFSTSGTVLEPSVLSLSLLSKQDINCFGDITGTISVNGVGGVAPYEYSLDGTTYRASNIFSDLVAGNYLVRVKDNYGCVRSLNITLTQPAAQLSMTFSMTPVQCKRDANGKIETIVTGGTAPYSYVWQGLAETVANIEGLTARTYNLTITDAQGCKLVKAIDVTEPVIALQAFISNKSNITCSGFANGSFKLDAIGGYPPYQYSFDGGAYNLISSYNNLGPATYSLNVRDARGCFVFVSAEITEPLPLTSVAVNVKNVSCFGGNDAQFEVEAQGGTVPFVYSKNGGTSFQSVKIFDTLLKGTYPVQVKDANNCLFSFTVVISEPTLLQTTVGSVVNAACGQANGSAQVLPTGGTLPYQYSWKNSLGIEVSTTQRPTSLFSGVYIATTTDAKGCTATATQIINDDDAPTVAISSLVNATCFDSADGSATATASGGAGGYSFVWSDVRDQATANAANLSRGTYFVTVTDVRGCKSLTSVTITSPAAIQHNIIQQTLPLCNESCDGILEITGVGGVAPYTYAWLTGETAVAGKATSLCKGLHRVKITDAANCAAVIDLTLSAPVKLDTQVSNIKQATCAESCDASISIVASGGTAPYKYLWNDPQKQTTAQANNLCIGTYSVIVTDTQNCAVTKTIILDKVEPIKIDLGKAATLCYEQTLTLDAGLANASYTWTKDKIAFADKRTVIVKEAGEYEVGVKDSKGCSGSGSIAIKTSNRSFDANFLSASGLVVGDTLKLTEICFPKADSLKWSFDKKFKVAKNSFEQPELVATEPGSYDIILTGYHAECTDVAKKTVTYYKYEDRDKIKDKMPLGLYGIKNVTARPNPTSGLVTIEVEMHQPQLVAAFLYSMDGRELARGRDQEKTKYQFEFDLTNNISGVYIAMIRTDNQSRTIRIVLVK